MSSSNYHIPFPRNFLAVNTPIKKSTNAATTPYSPPADLPHSFLSNVPTHRKDSMSSNASTEPPSPPTKALDAASSAKNTASVQAVPNFLTLAAKYTPPPVSELAPPGADGGFLSNKPQAPKRK